MAGSLPIPELIEVKESSTAAVVFTAVTVDYPPVVASKPASRRCCVSEILPAYRRTFFLGLGSGETRYGRARFTI